jgi:pyoverdine/dityrosine biosynthesis protein Dit1
VATTDTYTDKVRELYEQMERHGVPKIADLTVRQMRNAIKDTGLRFDTSLVTSRFIADYVARTPTLQPLRLDTDD